ncbi:MAG: Coenzyme F420 hydrogenase/dehydrogenase, beta subunit C-terminal domain [Candidatus Jordarchaeum sp.]|uniref:Coenzyme F420 hydrogenase/dehydrogenase, beta subunit C-terminal domain n=1 Tax=Candidatus Jordarchaeum sp. TaxID=2823881 RepID=UPI0040493A91
MKIGDSIIASSKDEKLSATYGGGTIQTILRKTLENKLAEKVVSFQEKKDRYSLVPVIIEQPDQINSIPLSQFSAYYLSGLNSVPKYIQQNLKNAEKVVVIAKPCDVRAIVELAKRKQINLDNLVILGEECQGKISPKKVQKNLEEEQVDASKVTNEMIEGNKYNIIIEGRNRSYIFGEKLDLEESCKRCGEREPNISDISFQVIKDKDKTKTLININSEKGLKIIQLSSSELNLEEINEEILNRVNRNMDLSSLKAERYKVKQFKNFDKNSEEERYSYFKNLIENCRKCGNCIRACPICVCIDCTVIKQRKEIEPILYFLQRMGHMGESCINCGNCDSACNFLDPGPSLLFHRLSELSKKALDYDPGKDVNEPAPRSGRKVIKKS